MLKTGPVGSRLEELKPAKKTWSREQSLVYCVVIKSSKLRQRHDGVKLSSHASISGDTHRDSSEVNVDSPALKCPNEPK